MKKTLGAGWPAQSAIWKRLINHCKRKFNKACRDSLYNGPTWSKPIVGKGAICTLTREELDAPYIELDRIDDIYGTSQQYIEDRNAVVEVINILAGIAADFGVMLMRKFVMLMHIDDSNSLTD